MKKIILGLVIAMMSVMSSKASHQVAGDVGYECIGNNQYVFYVYFYRDCSGISAPGSLTMAGTSSCGTVSMPMNQVDLSPNDPSTMGFVDTLGLCSSFQTTCNGGQYPGTEVYRYETAPTTITPCSDWSFCASDCCRNPSPNFPPYTASTNYTGSSLAYFCTMDNADGACDDSPVWNAPPRAYVCQDIETYMDNGAVDADGDSLVYELVSVLDGCGTATVAYNPPFSDQYPISTTTGTFPFDQATGVSIFTPLFLPGQFEVSVLGVRISSYRNGILRGTILRDMQIVTLHDCDPLNAYSSSPDVEGATKTSDDSMYICAGDTLLFDIIVFDTINGGGFTLSSDIKKTLPNATVTVIDTLNPSGNGTMAIATISLPTTNNDVGTYSFNMKAKNAGCPIQITELFKFYLDIKPNTVATATPDTTCYGLEDSVQLLAEGGSAFTWILKDDSQMDLSCTDCPDPYSNPIHTMTYHVISDLQQFGCGFEDSVVVTVVPRVDILGELEVCFEDTSVLTIDWNWTPTPGVDYLWNDDDDFIDTFMYAFTGGTYILSVMDTVDLTNSIFCTLSDTVEVIVKDCPPIIPNIITPNNDGFNDVFFIENIRRQIWNLKVYSRWGNQLLEERRDYQNDWKGGDLADGMYYYTLTNQDGAIITELKGWLQISR